MRYFKCLVFVGLCTTVSAEELAQVQTCKLDYFGNGKVEKNLPNAKISCRIAADQGSETAQLLLGYMYTNGKGVPQDYKEALKWYRLAADQGKASAQFNLALMYANGQGVPQEFIEAHKWFNLAGSAGSEKGAKQRDAVANKMTAQQISQAQALAREWKPTVKFQK